MTDLSPAAQSVKDAVLATCADNVPKDDSLWALERPSTVAALRAAARFNPGPFVPELFGEGWNAAMGELRNIATELEGLDD